MKHFLLKTSLSVFLLLGATSLVACSGASLPTTSYDKVRFAFNGVENSFKNPRINRNSRIFEKNERLGGNNPEEGLSAIFNLYNEEDKRDDFLDNVEYNQPPMVQFQYLKKVFEKVGSGYEFGTKYYDIVTGDVYLDIQTGLKSEKESDKFNYTFNLAMDININSNDLISADVSFDIKIARGQEEYNTKWYVAIELDYDMNNSSPNYVMTMVTENNESELPYYKHYTYEYDYVEVKNSVINEWRKFCMDNSSRLIKDAAHPTFDSYTGDGFKYRVDACSWYKDGVYYKNKMVKQLGESEAKIIGQALFGNLGLNATEINADAFFNKASTQNSVLKTCYQEFSSLAREDIIYSLLTKEESEPEQKQKSAIRAMNGDLTGGAGGYSIPKDTNLSQVFNGFVDAYGEKVVIRLCYFDQNGGLMEEIRNLDSLSFFFKLKDKSATVMFDSLGETLESAYNKLVENNEFTVNDLTRDCEIVFLDQEDMNINGIMSFIYSGDLPNIYVKPEWPNGFKNLGVPEYDGEEVEYTYSEDPYLQGNKKYLDIKNSTYEEGEAYCRKLSQNGFEQSFDYDTQENEILFKKAISEEYNLYVAFKYGKSISNFFLTAWKEEAPIIPPEPEQPFHVYVVGDFNNWGKEDSPEFISNYEDGLWTFVLEDFHVSENESFAFVGNPKDFEEDYFGFNSVVDDAIGFFDMDYDRQPYAMKALQEFTATFTISEDRLIHFEFNNSQTEISFLTIVGSFNDWSETEGMIEMEKNEDGFEITVSFKAKDEFKIMQNHSWTINYGFTEITNKASAEIKNYFASGENDNVIVLKALTFTLTAADDGTGHAAFKMIIVN